MTEPTRDALHAETLHYLEFQRERRAAIGMVPSPAWKRDAEMYAYAAECVKEVQALREQVEALDGLRRSVTHYRGQWQDALNERNALRAENATLTDAHRLVQGIAQTAIADRNRLSDENARLAEWKESATQVLGEWDAVWEAAGKPGPLGSSKADNTRWAVERLAATVDAIRSLCSVGESEDGEYWCLWLVSKHEKPDGDYGPAAIYFRSMVGDAEEQKREDGDPNWGPDVDGMLAEFAAAYAKATATERTDA